MNALELTGAVTALANAIARSMTIDEMALVASILVQLGDTLATIVARENLFAGKKTYGQTEMLPPTLGYVFI